MHGSTARSVVIAAHDNTTELPGQINNFIGICAIADDVAEVPDGVVFWCSGKNSLECLEIGVNVGNNKCSHVSFTFVLWLYFLPGASAVMRLPGAVWCSAMELGR